MNIIIWAPTITLQGNLTEMIAEDGAGTESGSGEGMPSTLSGLFTEADDTNWSLALNLSFPLYSGGSKRAARKMAEEELNRLRLEREAVKEHIDQRIRSSLHLIFNQSLYLINILCNYNGFLDRS